MFITNVLFSGRKRYVLSQDVYIQSKLIQTDSVIDIYMSMDSIG